MARGLQMELTAMTWDMCDCDEINLVCNFLFDLDN